MRVRDKKFAKIAKLTRKNGNFKEWRSFACHITAPAFACRLTIEMHFSHLCPSVTSVLVSHLCPTVTATSVLVSQRSVSYCSPATTLCKLSACSAKTRSRDSSFANEATCFSSPKIQELACGFVKLKFQPLKVQ